MNTFLANKLEAEDTLVAAIELENGGLATLELTTAARPRDLEASITITGTKGVAEIGGIALNKINKWEFLDKEPTDETILSHSLIPPTSDDVFHQIKYLSPLENDE